MKFIIPILAGLSILLETSVFPFPLTLLTLFIVAISGVGNSYLLAFCAGLILDFFSLRILGISSCYFLLVLYLLERYSKKIQFQNKFFQIVYLAGVTVLYSYLFYRAFNIITFVEIVFGGGIFLFTFKGLFKRMSKGKKLSM